MRLSRLWRLFPKMRPRSVWHGQEILRGQVQVIRETLRRQGGVTLIEIQWHSGLNFKLPDIRR